MIAYLNIYLVFLRIGMVSFGGGLSMLPLIEKEILSRGWMTQGEFLDLVSISQMTPGPIAINAATYVGNKVLGVTGGIIATIGVMTPSVIIILILSGLIVKLKGNPYKDAFFLGMRPVVIALISFAGYKIAKATYILEGNLGLSVGTMVISLISFLVITKTKLNPIYMIVISGVLGLVVL